MPHSSRAARRACAVAVAADVADPDAAARAVDEHRGRYGRLDVLVNSAGIGIAGTVDRLPAKHFDLQVGVNLRGLFLVTQAAIPLLRESQGLIVNLASIAGTLPTEVPPPLAARADPAGRDRADGLAERRRPAQRRVSR